MQTSIRIDVNALDMLHFPVVSLDDKWFVRYANQAARALIETDPQGWPVRQLFAPEEWETIEKELARRPHGIGSEVPRDSCPSA